MSQNDKDLLLALIDGLTKKSGNQFQREEYIPKDGIKLLKDTIKRL